MITLDPNVLETATLSGGIVSLLIAVASIPYGMGWAGAGRRR